MDRARLSQQLAAKGGSQDGIFFAAKRAGGFGFGRKSEKVIFQKGLIISVYESKKEDLFKKCTAPLYFSCWEINNIFARLL